MEKSVYRSLLGERSTPFYVFDTQGFIENYQALQAAMQQVYPNYRVAYSYKTNYTPYICNLVKSLGGYAEVVSDMEYRLAKKLGYENSRIVYNGPAKGSCMEEHLRSGGISNVDNPAEAARVAKLAAACPECTIKIGLRINMDLGFVSRFGMSVGSCCGSGILKISRWAISPGTVTSAATAGSPPGKSGRKSWWMPPTGMWTERRNTSAWAAECSLIWTKFCGRSSVRFPPMKNTPRLP